MTTENLMELSGRLHMPALTLDELRGQEAAFDLIAYAEAARRSLQTLPSRRGLIGASPSGHPDRADWERTSPHRRESECISPS